MTDKIRFAVRKFDPFEQAMQRCWEQYKQEKQVDYEMEFVPLDLEELYDALFLKKGLENGDWDIAHINTDWLPQASYQGDLVPLNQFIKNNPPEKYEIGWSESLLSLQEFNGQIMGLPFHDGPECLVYRKDLFEDPQERERFHAKYNKELKVPETWTEFLEVSEFFNRPSENLYGSVFAGYPDGHNAVFDICIQIWSRGGEILKAGEITLSDPKVRESLEFYRKLFKTKGIIHPESENFESVKAGGAFANGEVAMMINWFGFASWAHIDEQSVVKGQVEIAPIPADRPELSPSLNVYWVYAISQGSRHKERAYDFIRYAVSIANDKALTLSGGVGCRRSTWHDTEINASIPFYKKLPELHETARSLPRMRKWADVAIIIDKMTTQAIQTDKGIQELIAEAEKEIKAL